MFQTRNGLPEATRKKSVALLQQALVNSIDLGSQIKHAHWNVKGPKFLDLHKLFDKLYEQVVEHTDTVAERLVALGGVASGTARVAAKTSKLHEYPIKAVSGKEHLEALADAFAAFGNATRDAIDAADKIGDADTTDIFTDVSRDADQALWFIEAHLQAKE